MFYNLILYLQASRHIVRIHIWKRLQGIGCETPDFQQVFSPSTRQGVVQKSELIGGRWLFFEGFLFGGSFQRFPNYGGGNSQI